MNASATPAPGFSQAASSSEAVPASEAAASAETAPFPVHAWPNTLRWLGMAAHGVALGSLLFFTARLLQDVVAGTQTVQLEPVARGLALGGLLPLVLVALLRRLTRATVTVEPTQLVLALRDGGRFEIPHDTLESIQPWSLPLPGPGLTLKLRSGRPFSHALEAQDPQPLLRALTPHGTLGAAREHPRVRYAQARQAYWLRGALPLAFKYGVVPLTIAGIFFRAHQYISFGGWLGEYQQHGLAAYLKTFGRFWLPVMLSLVLYACFWRALAEAGSFGAAWLGPHWARNVRRGAEWLCRLVYYAGLPAILIVRFFFM